MVAVIPGLNKVTCATVLLQEFEQIILKSSTAVPENTDLSNNQAEHGDVDRVNIWTRITSVLYV